jgi:hypothetical protein
MFSTFVSFHYFRSFFLVHFVPEVVSFLFSFFYDLILIQGNGFISFAMAAAQEALEVDVAIKIVPRSSSPHPTFETICI